MNWVTVYLVGELGGRLESPCGWRMRKNYTWLSTIYALQHSLLVHSNTGVSSWRLSTFCWLWSVSWDCRCFHPNQIFYLHEMRLVLVNAILTNPTCDPVYLSTYNFPVACTLSLTATISIISILFLQPRISLSSYIFSRLSAITNPTLPYCCRQYGHLHLVGDVELLCIYLFVSSLHT